MKIIPWKITRFWSLVGLLELTMNVGFPWWLWEWNSTQYGNLIVLWECKLEWQSLSYIYQTKNEGNLELYSHSPTQFCYPFFLSSIFGNCWSFPSCSLKYLSLDTVLTFQFQNMWNFVLLACVWSNVLLRTTSPNTPNTKI